MYNQKEVKAVQGIITGNFNLTQHQAQKLIALFKDGKVPRHTGPFLPLLESDPALFEKISKDERAQKYMHYGFFPSAYSMVYGSDKPPKLILDGGNRGQVVILEGASLKIVIKPLQSSREGGIALDAEKLGVGPKQYETLDGFLSEEFVRGKLLTRLDAEGLPKDVLHSLGGRMGNILSKLHKAGIFYNDTTVADDLGRSHFMVVPESPSLLFDYGVAMKLDNYPSFTHEETVDFFRTLPGVSMFFSLGGNREEAEMRLIEHFGPTLKEYSKDAIFDRDVQFVHEGLSLISRRISADWNAFLSGFKETYSR